MEEDVEKLHKSPSQLMGEGRVRVIVAWNLNAFYFLPPNLLRGEGFPGWGLNYLF
jgi:hypothetical protein